MELVSRATGCLSELALQYKHMFDLLTTKVALGMPYQLSPNRPLDVDSINTPPVSPATKVCSKDSFTSCRVPVSRWAV